MSTSDERNIVLTGFMGTGKSTVGRRLARRLARDFVDTDELVVRRHGPVASIFEAHGEAHFRALEAAVAAELGRRRGLVVATGGRLMLDQRNVEALGTDADVICLVTDEETLVRRLTASPVERPLLDDPDPASRIRELLAERRAAYAAFTSVETGGRTPDEVVDAILALLGLTDR